MVALIFLSIAAHLSTSSRERARRQRWCSPTRCWAHLCRGDLPRATGVLERCLDLCRRWQFAHQIPRAAAALGAVYALAGRADEALSLVEGADEEFRCAQNHLWPAFILLWAGRAYLSAGRTDEAAGHAREALALARRLGLGVVWPTLFASTVTSPP